MWLSGLVFYHEISSSRAEVDQNFLTMLGPWTSLAEPSRSTKLIERAKDIQFDDKLQQEILQDIYNYHAFLFWPLFPELPETAIQAIAISGRLYADHLLLLDHVMDDENSGFASLSLFKADLLHQESLSILYQYF